MMPYHQQQGAHPPHGSQRGQGHGGGGPGRGRAQVFNRNDYGGGRDYGGGGSRPTPNRAAADPIKRFENLHYCHTHGSNMDDNHTSATCARPGKHHQRAATRVNTMGINTRGMNKTILPSAVGRAPPTPRPLPRPINYAPTLSTPFGANGPRFPMTPRSWGFGPHAAAYAHANNSPQPNWGQP
jgi:hypothetical protein